MDQVLEFAPVCSRHKKSMGEGPQCFNACREETRAAPKAHAAEPVLVVEPAPKTAKLRQARAVLESVTQTTLSNAARQARWRKSHPEDHRTTQKARWARKTSGKTQGAQ